MKSKVFKEIGKIIYNACLYFTVAAFILMISAVTMGDVGTTTTTGQNVTSYQYLIGTMSLLFLGCFAMSVLNLIWKLRYSVTVKLLLHFLCALAAYIVIFVWLHGRYSTMEQILVRVLLFVVVYFVIAFAALIIGSIRKNRKAEKLEYDSQFENKK